MAAVAEPIVVVEDLRKRYPGASDEAVKGISFTINDGEIFGLLGPNGAGKTTTIGILTTRVIGTGGRAVVDGFDVSHDPVSVKQRIAVVPQQPNLDRSMTALENLTFHAAYFGFGRAERRKRGEEMLEAFGLGGRGNDKVDRYSGGMAQRLMIARALMHRPRILFLDEPTTGLDPQARLFLWDQIEALRDAGTTILLTTHDMTEADRLCSRIAVVDHGERIALDTPRGLRSLLPGEGGVELLVEGEIDGALFDTLGNHDQERIEERTRVRVYGEVALGAVLQIAEGSGATVVDLKPIEGTLEDVFVYLTGRDLR